MNMDRYSLLACVKGWRCLGGMLAMLLTPTIALAVQTAPSIADSFSTFWKAARDQPYAVQVERWDEIIEGNRKDIYNAVVWEAATDPNWRDWKQRLLRARFPVYAESADKIMAMAKSLEANIPARIAEFKKLFPDASAHPAIQVLLAPNFDAKSGVMPDNSPVLAFAVDSLFLEHADMDIVFPHELFHLYHASHSGITNDGVMPDADLTLPLFAEGLATYVSSQFCPGHTDGDYLLQENLGALGKDRIPEIAQRFLADADYKAIDRQHPEAFKRWFNVTKAGGNANLPDRAGYWLGLAVIRRLAHAYSLQDIASWRPEQAQMHARAVLHELADGHHPGT